VAALRKVLLDAVSDADLQIVAEQLVVKAKMGDLAATKLLFQYVLGKPSATVDPDSLDVQEVELYGRAPVHGEVGDILAGRMSAELAAGLLRRVVPYTGVENAATVGEALHNAFAEHAADHDELGENEEDDEDDEDFEDRERKIAGESSRPVAVAERAETAPATNGGMDADPRRRATPPSANGPFSRHDPSLRDSDNGDNGGRLPDPRRPGLRPPRGI
jgi:hypothetical protein